MDAPSGNQPLAIIVVTADGVGQALVSNLKNNPKIVLHPWARLEGTMRAGNRVLRERRRIVGRDRQGEAVYFQELFIPPTERRLFIAS